MHFFLKLLVVTILTSLSWSSAAFDPNKHEQITKQAFALYDVCQRHYPNKLKLTFGTQDKDQITRATHDIDNPTIARLVNWHFFDKKYDHINDRPGNIPVMFGFIHRSLHHYFLAAHERIKNKLAKSKTANINKEVGELMHFIQDMAVPAHVTPIFHMFGYSDPLDAYQPKTPITPNINSSTCEKLIAEHKNPVDLLLSSAHNTLGVIDAKQTSQRWHHYWQPSSKSTNNSGFGEYGTCGRAGFGKTNDAPCNKTNEEYNAFYAKQYHQAVIDSIRLLFHMSRIVTP